MRDKIQINTLGRFEVIVNNSRIDQKLGKSKKSWTIFKYLLLHIGEDVPFRVLYDTLWPNEESTNPESALKTLISRLRAFLNQSSIELGKCIITSHGAYSWNQAVECEIDFVIFEELCKSIEGEKSLTPENKPIFDKILSLYAGALLPANSQDGWAVSKGVALHNAYVKSVYRYLDLLKKDSRYNDIIRVCRTALEIDAFDERFHLELMDALVHTDKSNEAMRQYSHAKNMHFRYLGEAPPEGITEFYKKIIRADNELDMDIDRILGVLREHQEKEGAFVCEFTVFKEIYNLQMRYLERTGTTMFIALIMISNADGEPMEPLKLNEINQLLLSILVKNLRKGDTITHYTAAQYALLLPTVNYETGKMVMERIKNAFYNAYPNSSVICNYRLGPIKEA